MNLLQEWNDMNSELADKNQLLSKDITSVQKSSGNVYLKLLKNLHAKMTWIMALSIPLLLGAFFTTGLLQELLIGMLFCYTLGRQFMMQQVHRLPEYIDHSTVTKDVIAYQLKMIDKVFKMEKFWVYLLGPFVCPAAYLAALAFKYETLDQIMVSHPNLPYVLLGLTLLVFPIHYLGSLMNKYAFGADVEKLSANLKELQG